MAFYKVYNDNNGKNDKGPVNWIFVLFMLMVGAWPIALILAIANVASIWEQRSNRKTKQNNNMQWNGSAYRSTYHQSQTDFTDQNATDAAPEADHTKNFNQERARSLKNRKILSSVFLIAGAVIAATGLPNWITVLKDIAIGMFDSFTVHYSLFPALYSLIGGGVLGFMGSRMKRALRLEKLMATITGDADNITIKQLSSASGYTKKETLDLVKDAINHGLFGPSAYIDMRTDTLVIRGEAPTPPPKKPRKKKTDTTEKQKEEEKNKYRQILRQLRDVNDAIPGEEMSAKIDKLEDISARIFALAEKDPEKKEQMGKFMDYYLPTALKLLDTYATLDQQGMQGQNVTETKASIENAMDMLANAFAGQLDKLFQSDVLDVSSDIAALQSMLTMDGLTEDGLLGAAPQSSDPN